MKPRQEFLLQLKCPFPDYQGAFMRMHKNFIELNRESFKDTQMIEQSAYHYIIQTLTRISTTKPAGDKQMCKFEHKLSPKST